jgi:hypothetical protein
VSYIRYFIYKTKTPENFEEVIRHIRINGEKVVNLKENERYKSDLSSLNYEMKTIMKRTEKDIEIETWIINEKRLIKNSYGKYDYEGNLIESRIYSGPESEKYYSTLDDRYHSKMLNEIVCCKDVKEYWDEIRTNDELPKIDIMNKMCGVIIKRVNNITEYNPVKITMSSIEVYFKGKEKMYYLEHLMRENNKVMCYMLNEENEEEINIGISGLLGMEVNGDVLLVDWNNKRISRKDYENIIKYLYNLDKKKLREDKLREFEELMKKDGYKVNHFK